MRKYLTFPVVLTTLLLAACAATNEDIGTLSGGAVGALLGAQVGQGSGRTLAIATGAIAGAMLGNRIGRTMDRQDQLYLQQALEKQSDGKPRAWRNPNTHNTYQVTPMRTYYRQHQHHRQPCRRYVTTAIIAGKAEKITGTACRLPDGTWRTA
jgi:surface antigen